MDRQYQIVAAASLLTPGYLIEAHSTTHGYQIQGMRTCQPPIHDIPLTLQVDELSLKCIEPQLLCISHPEDSALIETPHASTLETQPDFWMFPSPTLAAVAAAYHEDHYAAVTSTYRPLSPPLLEVPAQRARPNDRVRTQRLLRVTRSGGPNLLKASSSNHCTILSPLTIGNASTKSSQS